MSAFAINFSLKPLGDIVPWGGEQKSLLWFGMTGSELWITAALFEKMKKELSTGGKYDL